MAAIDRVLTQTSANNTPSKNDVDMVFKLLSRSRVAPVIMPVAAAKNTMKEVKI
jgi:hypothetical protein